MKKQPYPPKEYCVSDHKMTPENTYLYTRSRGAKPWTERRCRKCILAAVYRQRGKVKDDGVEQTDRWKRIGENVLKRMEGTA